MTTATDFVVDVAPPVDREAEAGVLGAMLNSPEALAEMLRMLRPAFFSVPEHGRLFRAIEESAEGLEPEERLDLVTVERYLRATDSLEALGGRDFLITLSESCAAPSMARFHALALQRSAAMRDAYNAALTLARQTTRPGAKVNALRATIDHLSAILARVDTNGELTIGHSTAAISILADIAAERLTWLWQGRIPGGKVTLLAGDPGRGKTLLSLDIAARVSRGMPWPDSPGERHPPGGVVLLSAEDDAADTIRPRLDAAGADVQRIVLLTAVKRAQGERSHFNLASDLPALENAIRRTPDCRLVIIDPISAYLGGTDSHKNAEIRGLLAPLAEVAARHGVAILAVTHLNKAGGGRAMYRAMGSLGFVAMARAAWLVQDDPDDQGGNRRLLLPMKCNLAVEPTGLAYHVLGVDLPGLGSVARVEWEDGPVSMTADQALVGNDNADGRSVVESAKEFLAEALKDGPLTAADLETEAKSAGVSWAAVLRAKKPAGVACRKDMGKDAPWRWHLEPKPRTTPYTQNLAQVTR